MRPASAWAAATLPPSQGSGNLIEVGEVLLLNEEDVFKLIPYWSLFENRRVLGWGRPEDW